MDEPAILIRSSSCDVKTCPNNENTVKAQAKEMGEVLKGWPLNPFKVYPPAWFRNLLEIEFSPSFMAFMV